MKKELKIGDVITILSEPRYWSSGCNGQDGRNKVKYPYTATIVAIRMTLTPYTINTEYMDEVYGWYIDCLDYIITEEQVYEIF